MFANNAYTNSSCPVFPGMAFARAQLACKKASTLFRLLAPAPIRTFSYMKLRLFQLPLPLSGPNMGCVHKMSICTKLFVFKSRLTETALQRTPKSLCLNCYFRMRSLCEDALHRKYAHAATVCSACTPTREAKVCIQTVPSSISWQGDGGAWGGGGMQVSVKSLL